MYFTGGVRQAGAQSSFQLDLGPREETEKKKTEGVSIASFKKRSAISLQPMRGRKREGKGLRGGRRAGGGEGDARCILRKTPKGRLIKKRGKKAEKRGTQEGGGGGSRDSRFFSKRN